MMSSRRECLRISGLVLLGLCLAGSAARSQLDADFAAAPMTGANPLTVVFWDATTGGLPLIWLWDFGDGTGSLEQNPIHTYTTPGEHTVRLTVFLGLDVDTETKPGLVVVSPSEVCEVAKLISDDSAAHDEFGYSVAISDTIAIAGAYRDDDNGCFSGSAYLFDTETGVQLAKLLPSDGESGDYFGWSVAISDTTALVGAPFAGDNAAGAAYLFDTATGQELARLVPCDDDADPIFGRSVALSGTTALIGAIGFNSDSGSAYLFDTTTGQQLSKLLAVDGAADDSFGWSVALSGTTALVGALEDDDNGSDSGSAYLFDTTTGEQLAKLLPGDGAADDLFGWAVAISGTTALVGAPRHDDNGPDSGSAYLFDTTTGAQFAELLPPDGTAVDQFGRAVAIAGSTVLVGSPDDDDNGSGSGTVSLFDATSGALLSKFLPGDGEPGDDFGTSIAIRGSSVIVGARDDDGAGTDSGSAYLFDVSLGAWTGLGHGLAGSHGVPSLEGAGLLAGGCPVNLVLTNAAAGSLTYLVVGLTNISTPLHGGVLVPSPDVRLAGLVTDVNGDLLVSTLFPDGVPAGTTLYFQHWIVDTAGPEGFAASNGLSGTTP